MPDTLNTIARGMDGYTRAVRHWRGRDGIERADAGCQQGCDRCTVQCAVATGLLDDYRARYSAALAEQPPFYHRGRRYPFASAGRA